MAALRSGPVRTIAALGALAAVVVVALDVPHATSDFSRAFGSITGERLPWLGATVCAEACSVACFALVQRELLASGPHRLRLRSLLRLSVAANGLQAILPVGAVPAGGWLVAQYRKVRVSTPFAVYLVLAAFFAAFVSLLGLLLVGALVAGIGSDGSLVSGAIGLVAFTWGAIALAHRFGERPDAAHALVRRHVGRLASAVRVLAGAARCRVGVARGARVLALSAGTWLFDCGCLVLAFELMGLAVPWRGVLLAYAIAQAAGGVSPLPGGIGAVEGGLVGGLALVGVNAGDALAATLAYRLVSYWGEGLVGGATALLLARRPIHEVRTQVPETLHDPLDLHPAGSALEPA